MGNNMPSLLGVAAAAIAIGMVTSPTMPSSTVQTAPQIAAGPATDSSGAVTTPRKQARTETAAVSEAH
jgi:hypothetical protein